MPAACRLGGGTASPSHAARAGCGVPGSGPRGRRWGGGVHPPVGAPTPADIGFQGHQAQFEDLVRALEQGHAPLVDGAEAVRAVEIILSIYESARSGGAVELRG